MHAGEIEFTLPLGYMDEDGMLTRRGKMKPATAYDELVVQEHERNQFNKRYRDILMLSQVITELGDIKTVTPEIIEELFEMDFIYLQMLYKELNSAAEKKTEVQCPACGNVDEIAMANLFEDMFHYYQQADQQTEKT